MAPETEKESLLEEFLEVIQNEEVLRVREFLNQQNISDVAELIYEYPEYQSKIISNMSVHRASSVF